MLFVCNIVALLLRKNKFNYANDFYSNNDVFLA